MDKKHLGNGGQQPHPSATVRHCAFPQGRKSQQQIAEDLFMQEHSGSGSRFIFCVVRAVYGVAGHVAAVFCRVYRGVRAHSRRHGRKQHQLKG